MKQSIPMGIGIATDNDGMIPGERGSSIICLAAQTEDYSFCINLLPEDGTYHKRSWWSKHPAHWEMMMKDPKPPKEGIEEFYSWVKKFRAKPIAVGYGWHFWWLYYYMRKYVKRCPFEDRFLDVNSYQWGKNGNLINKGFEWKGVMRFHPSEIAKRALGGKKILPVCSIPKKNLAQEAWMNENWQAQQAAAGVLLRRETIQPVEWTWQQTRAQGLANQIEEFNRLRVGAVNEIH